MARNPVAANLLMIFIMVGGVMVAFNIRQEVFPEFDLDLVLVSVPYPGASPEEVEEGIILAVEEELNDITGIKKITSTASEGRAVVVAELHTDTDPNKALQDIKGAVDRITTIPEDAERPTVRMIVPFRQVIVIMLYGDQEEGVLRALAEDVRGELLEERDITSVDLIGVRPPEISLEIPQDDLSNYGLPLCLAAGMGR